jgi:hypothetical protein
MQKLSSQIVKDLNLKKIFCIPSQNQRWMSYFIIRSWGNYLFFPHPDVSNIYPFIKGQGGIYKVFDEAVPFPFYNAEIFTLFGASTIGSNLIYHPDFQIEKYGEDFSDVDLRIDQGIFKLNHQKEEYSFYDFNRPEESFSSNEFSRIAMISSPDA